MFRVVGDMNNEEESELTRVNLLHSYGILDTPRESRFDDLTSMIAELLKIPFAKIGFFDQERIWYKSTYGFNAQEGAIAGSIAQLVMENPHDVTLIPDVENEPRLIHSTARELHLDIHSAAAVPILSADKYVIGMLCVFDTTVRDFTVDEIRALKRLSRQITELMDAQREANELQQDLREQRAILRIKATSDRIARTLIGSVNTRENLHTVMEKFIQGIINEFGWWGGQAWLEEDGLLKPSKWVFSVAAPPSLNVLNKVSVPPIELTTNIYNEILNYETSTPEVQDVSELQWHPNLARLESAGARSVICLDVSGPSTIAMRIFFILPTERSYTSNARSVFEELKNLLPQVVRRARSAEELSYRATHDELTGLLNRRGLEELFPLGAGELLGKSSRSILFIDIDKFKAVNDEHGHAVGDEYLIEISKRLVDSSRPVDSIARIGGDEFIIIAQGLDDLEVIQNVTSRLLENLNQPFITIDKIEFQPRVSIGVARWNSNELLNTAISHADTRMYAAKSLGGQQASIDISGPVTDQHEVSQIPELRGISIHHIASLDTQETRAFFVLVDPPVYFAPRVMQATAAYIHEVIEQRFGQSAVDLPVIVEMKGFKRSDRSNLDAFFDSLLNVHHFTNLSYAFDTRLGTLDAATFARELKNKGLVNIALSNFGKGSNEIALIQDLTPSYLLVSLDLLEVGGKDNGVILRLISAISKSSGTPIVIPVHFNKDYLHILSNNDECMVMQDTYLGKE